jgi:hypothetical protein
VEVDGPTHFLGDGRTPSGSTLLKRKQLGQLGYTVVPVTFWEWDALRGEEAKQRYLQVKLRWMSRKGEEGRPTRVEGFFVQPRTPLGAYGRHFPVLQIVPRREEDLA